MSRAENILLLGLGGVGVYVPTRLASEGHNVTVIDRDAARLAEADAQLDARLVVADARRVDLHEVDAAKVGTLIAVTDDDGINVLSCLIADKLLDRAGGRAASLLTGQHRQLRAVVPRRAEGARGGRLRGGMRELH